jgi:hypothetical protein
LNGGPEVQRTRGLLSRTTAKDEGFAIKNNREGRGVCYQEQPRRTRGLLSRTTAKDEGFTEIHDGGINYLRGGGGEPEGATTWGPGVTRTQ